MRMKNTAKKEQDQNSESIPLNPPYSNELSGWKLLRDPAAVFSSWGKIRKKIEGVKIEVPVNALANDNIGRRALLKLRTASLVFGAFILGAMLGINSSAVATQVVLHADDQILATAMDISPEMLAHILNVMDVGEVE